MVDEVEEGSRVVLDLPFEVALGATTRAIQAEGLEVIARVDVRTRFWDSLRSDFRRYYLLEAWASDEALELLRASPDRGATLPTRFAVFQLVDGQTAIVASDCSVQVARILARLCRLPGSMAAPAA
jgi:uncharacterized protein (DUF302 family)